ncbi:TcpQ domain-containing protein [Castellaniella defragrans]
MGRVRMGRAGLLLAALTGLAGLGGCAAPADGAWWRDLAGLANPPGVYRFDWRIAGDPALAPLQVFDDGRETWLQYPADQPAPAVFERTARGDRLLRPRRERDYLVLSGVPERVVLRGGLSWAEAWRGAGAAPDAAPAMSAPEGASSMPAPGSASSMPAPVGSEPVFAAHAGGAGTDRIRGSVQDPMPGSMPGSMKEQAREQVPDRMQAQIRDPMRGRTAGSPVAHLPMPTPRPAPPPFPLPPVPPNPPAPPAPPAGPVLAGGASSGDAGAAPAVAASAARAPARGSAVSFEVTPADGNVRRALGRWAHAAGWTFEPEHWDVDADIPLAGSAVFGDSFRAAVRGLLSATELGDRPVQPCFYANRVLRVVPLAQRCDRTRAPGAES